MIPYSCDLSKEILIEHVQIIQHNTLLLHNQARLPSYYSIKCLRAKQGGSLYHFYDGLWYDPAGAQTYNLLHGCEYANN